MLLPLRFNGYQNSEKIKAAMEGKEISMKRKSERVIERGTMKGTERE